MGSTCTWCCLRRLRRAAVEQTAVCQPADSDKHERHNGEEARYLMGTPLLADYLEEGASQLGYAREDLEEGLP